ncbi:MAG: SDR family oxidoreductase [Methanomassiliicoccales archaeon]
MFGKVVLITGSTSGIGLVTATAISAMGATVVIHGRDARLAQEVVMEIKEKTKNPAVYFLLADLGNLSEVRSMADRFRRNFHRLDVLVNNAGAMFGKRQESVDGLEMTFQVNYLSHFLLTNLLIDMLCESAPARIVNVSATQHERGRLDFNDLQMKKKYSAQKAYAASKLAVMLFTYEMARRISCKGVTCNAVNPGLAKTQLGYRSGLLTSLSKRMTDLLGKSAEKAAETTIYLATAPELEGVTGKYFEDKVEQESSEMSYNQEMAKRLWEVSMELCKLSKN